MLFKGPGGYGRIMNLVMNLVLCACFSAYALWVAQHVPGNESQPIFTPLGWFVSYVSSFCVGMVVADFIPSYRWGEKLAERLGLKGVAAYALMVLVVTFFMVTIMSFVCTWMNNVQRAGMGVVMVSFLSTYPAMFIGGYVIEFIIMKPAMTLATKISGFDPKTAPPMGAPGVGGPGAGAPGGPGVGGPGAPSTPGGPGVGGPGVGGPGGPGTPSTSDAPDGKE